jgi:signal transduction histidine kinase
MNLLVNAAQAIGKETGEVKITTGADDDQVYVSISDTGNGIDTANLNRVFDPFFTTKAVGEGTGLGLSIAFGIVDRHHGRIEVQSEPQKGTTFTVSLPRKTNSFSAAEISNTESERSYAI